MLNPTRVAPHVRNGKIAAALQARVELIAIEVASRAIHTVQHIARHVEEVSRPLMEGEAGTCHLNTMCCR